MNFGIEGLHMCITEHYLLQEKLSKVFHKSKKNMIESAKDDDPSKKKTRYESEYSSSDNEYVLISALTGNITHGSTDWFIDSGASKHMTGFKESFARLL